MSETTKLLLESVILPEAFEIVTKAFDESWASIRCMFAGQPQSIIDDARTVLAMAVVNAASAGHAHVDDLKQKGIRAVRVAYPHMTI